MRHLLSCFAVTSILLSASCGSETQPGLHTQFADSTDPDYAESFDTAVDPRISTSGGEQGGVVVLWPRVVPEAEERQPDAALVQRRLAALAHEAAEGSPVDTRPAPQRTCPRDGCEGAAIGAVLRHRGESCAVVVTVALPGPTPARLVPWAAEVELTNTVVQFREPPEAEVRVTDYLRCESLPAALEERADEIRTAIAEVIR